MKSFRFNDKDHKVFAIKAFGEKYDVIVVKQHYRNGNALALTVHNIVRTGDGGDYADSFGILTVNLGQPALKDDHAYVKTYSENDGWAKELAKKIGGVDTGITSRSGFVDFPLYDFSKLDIYAE